MSQVMRLYCRNCLRIVDAAADLDAASAEDHPVPSGGDEYDAPPSLMLTPEELDGHCDAGVLTPTVWAATAPSVVPSCCMGRFQLRELLGGGGFGQVYRAYDPRLDRDVALKVLREPHPTGRVMERFFREARAAAQLDHPCIVPLHDAGRDQGRCWIAYQFVDGRTLSQTLKCSNAAIDVAAAARLVRDLADALAHAHRRGVVHRDVKPSNIILDGSGRPRLTDFGLALRVECDAGLTVEGAVLGTPAYMSPEQASGQGRLADARTDLYSLGVIFHELLCGCRPGDLPSGIPAWRASVQARRPLTPPRTRNPRVPRQLDRICRKALEPDPVDRYAEANELIEDLDQWLDRGRLRAGPMLWRLGAAAALAPALIGLGAFIEVRAGRDAARTSTPAPEPTPAAAAPTSWLVLPDQPAAPGPVVVLAGKRLFHREGCPASDQARPRAIERLPDAAAARRRGFTACLLCRP